MELSSETTEPPQRFSETPEDVLAAWLNWSRKGPVALAVLTHVTGGGVRAPGAMMAIGDDGLVCGYLSGGCVDGDIVFQACQSLKTGKPKALRYGAGSPYIDVPLPCGGTIDVVVLPSISHDLIRDLHNLLIQRTRGFLRIDADFQVSTGGVPAPRAQNSATTFLYAPRLRLRIAGAGADCLALAHLASASGIETEINFARDGDASHLMGNERIHIRSANPADQHSQTPDDRWTAFVLMNHDPEWETAHLMDALASDVFYIGAVGSRRTHQRRCEALRTRGISDDLISMISAPIGNIPGMRSASTLGVSTLGEIIARYDRATAADCSDLAVILLAAGSGERFNDGDKLMTPLEEKPVLAHSGSQLRDLRCARRVAVIHPDQSERRLCLEALGWEIVANPAAKSGQASSLRAGLEAALSDARVRAVTVALGDMPRVPDHHFEQLKNQIDCGFDAVMSHVGDITCPPAIFKRNILDEEQLPSGDRGAKALFEALDNTTTLPIDAECAIDIDRREDLQKMSLARHG